MAIYHLSTQAISRGQGRSIVACAAYRAAEQLLDQHYAKIHDYRRKENVAYKEVFLPEGAPEWLQDREALWNHVEKIEKRKDARLAREVQFALPRELSLEQNKALAQEFVKEVFVKQGMIADVCLHIDKGEDGGEQPHCHVLLTTREVDEDGFKQKKTQWNKKELLLEWREAWANKANEHLAKHGHELKIDHRSYKEQQIALEPQRKIGSAKLRLRVERLAEHEKIARENGERIY
ncbi:MAG: Ti-type conjugative transfer relaxase TraA, partial [Sphingobacteriaceae bacterium]